MLLLALVAGSPPVAVAIAPTGFTAFQPQIASSGGRAFVACGAGDRIYVLASEDGGRTFRVPVRLPSSGHLMLGMRRGPRIAISGESVVVSAVLGREGGGADGDLLAWRSSDEGRTWSAPVQVSDVPGAAREGLHAMAASATGRVACTWLDLRSPGTEIWSSISNDGGATWSKNVRVYRSPDKTVCECCHPSAAFGPRGELYVMFRNWLGGSRDMYLSTSKDGGSKYGPAQKLGLGTWPLNACPMDGGSIGVAPDGTVTTVWRRGGQVFLCQPGKAEVKVGEGVQPWMASGKDVNFVVWENEETVMGVSEGRPQPFRQGTRPTVAIVGDRGMAVWADESGTVWSQRL